MEKPVAKISIEPLDEDQTNRITLTQYFSADSQLNSIFLIKGDQWMLEGDILKWDNFMNFLGLHSRYRLTRIRGRYLRTRDEISQPTTVYSLVQNEDHPLWRNLYKFGYRLPFVHSVYGNAVFQNSNRRQNYLVFIGPSGFIVKKILSN
jgi:hypothetical protein